MADPKKPTVSEATGDHLAGGPDSLSVWHESPHLPRTIEESRQMYGDDLFGGPRG